MDNNKIEEARNLLYLHRNVKANLNCAEAHLRNNAPYYYSVVRRANKLTKAQMIKERDSLRDELRRIEKKLDKLKK